MKDYNLTVDIPIRDVPDDLPVEEVKKKAKEWLLIKIPDAKLIKLKESTK